MNSTVVIIPLIAALIGWITNFIAVRMLFRPRRPFKLLGIAIHGLVPKRQSELAESIGEAVSANLISHDDVTEVLRSPAVQHRMGVEVEREIDAFLQKFVASNPMVGMFLTGEVFQQVRTLLIAQLSERTPKLLEQVIDTLESGVDFKEIVRRKIEVLDLDRLEDLIYRVSSRELKTIELLGGVLGFFVGLVQVVVVEML